MKIAIIGPRSFPASTSAVSGLEVRSERVIEYLSQKYETYVYVHKWTNSTTLGNHLSRINVINIPTLENPLFDTLIYSILATIHALFSQCDIIMYEGTGSSTLLPLVRLFRKKTIFTLHAKEWERSKWNQFAKLYLQLIEEFAVRNATRTVSVSQAITTYVRRRYGIVSITILFRPQLNNLKPSISLLQRYGLKKESYILYLGRISPEKRVDWLLECYMKLKTNIKLVIAGNIDIRLSYSRSILKSCRDNKNIILTGPVHGSLKESLLCHCKLFLLPSLTEGLSISLTEALMYQRPVLVSNLPQHVDMIENHQFLFDANKLSDLGKKLSILINSPFKPYYCGALNRLGTINDFNTQYEKLIKTV